MSFLSSLIIHQYIGGGEVPPPPPPPPPPPQCYWGTAQGTAFSSAQGNIFVFNCLDLPEGE